MNREPKNQAMKKPRWTLRFLGIVLLLILSGVIIIGWWSSREAAALRGVVAGYARKGEPTKLAELEQPAIPDGENAAIDLSVAARKIAPLLQPWADYDKVGHVLPWTKRERVAAQAVVATYGPEIDRVHAATGKPKTDWRIRVRSPAISVALPDLNSMRMLANLLAGAALEAHVRGDDAAALDRVADMLFVSRAVDQMMPCVVRHLVSVGIRSLATNVLEQIAPDLNADDAVVRSRVAAIITQLGADEALLHQGERSGMMGERIFVLDSSQCVLSGKLTIAQLARMAGPTTLSGVMMSLPGGRFLGRPLVLADTRFCLERVTEGLDAADAPNWPAAQKLMAESDARWTKLLGSDTSHVFAKLMGASLGRSLETSYRMRTDSRLVATALAIRLYQADHGGALPTSLADLTPKYLPLKPVDPFAADGAALRYARGAEIIYSIGENGVDDGGSEASPKGARVMIGREPRWNAADAVLHLRRQDRDPQTVAEEMKEGEKKNADPTQNQ